MNTTKPTTKPETKTTEPTNKPQAKPAKARYRAQAKRFCVTLHNPRKDELELIKAYFDSKPVTLAVIARETGRNSIGHHLQIYFEVDSQIDGIKAFKDILGRKAAHVETAKGDLESNLNYVYAVSPKKDYEIG